MSIGAGVAFLRLWRQAQAKGYRTFLVPTVMVSTFLVLLLAIATVVVALAERLQVSDDVILPLSVSALVGAELISLLVSAIIVGALPVRRDHPSGRWRSRFPFRFVGWLSLALVPVVPAAVVIGGGDLLSALGYAVRIAIPAVPAAFGCFTAARRREKPDRDEPIGGSPTVLYVRGFADEIRYFAQRPDGDQEVSASPILDQLNEPSRRYATFEEYFEPTIRAQLGTLRGLGNLSDYLPPRGASRVYTPNEQWRIDFTKMVAEARGVVTSPGDWPHLPFELNTIRDMDDLQRFFILTPLVAHARRVKATNWVLGTRLETWAEFAAAARRPDAKSGRVPDYAWALIPDRARWSRSTRTAGRSFLRRGARTPEEYIEAISRVWTGAAR